ncbi:MAG: aromatic aminobenezylarsenical efflux permease ArsG family transporter [Bacteroidales bacterium]
MEWLQQVVDTFKNDLPVLAAFVLGLMTSISPCPLATNITATAYLSKDLTEKRRVLLNGVFYTLGRVFSYTALGLLFYFGASQFKVARLLQNVGGMWLGVALLVIGVFMLDLIKIPFFNNLGVNLGITSNENKKKGRYWDAFIIGVVFALAFCPFSGVLYFGVLIPMTIVAPTGLFLPPFFAIATGLPVIVIAYLLAYSITSVGAFYNKMKSFEKWFKWLIALLFILIGIYYIVINL